MICFKDKYNLQHKHNGQLTTFYKSNAGFDSKIMAFVEGLVLIVRFGIRNFMDIDAEKLNLIKWLTEVDDPSVVKLFVDLKNGLQGSGTMEWNLLPEHLKEQILKGLEEAELGLGTPAREVIKKSREKYGLNR